MTKKKFRTLRRGDIVRHVKSGDSYVIDGCWDSTGPAFIAIRTNVITNETEWELYTKSK